MYKFILICICFLMSVSMAHAQTRYITRNGYIWFFSKAPLEDIEAHNRQVSSVIDVATGEMVFSVPMKAFEFKKSLMQEHFNENYIESHKYPKATFKGTVKDSKAIDWTKEGTYPVKVEGDLTIHGVTKPVHAPGTLRVKNNKLIAQSTFIVAPEEYGIDIPSIVRFNIAEKVDVHVEMEYEPVVN